MTRRRVGLPPGFTVSGALRRTAWRQAFQLLGGFTVSGSAPYEAMVVVANHSSHADTPALVAAFPAPYKPVVVAADDYWFSKRWMRWLLGVTIGAVPVHRVGGGGYDSLVEGAQGALGKGSSLLMFPEGTRTRDGRLGQFHTGALRIAREFDVPLLPVAVVGTHRLLPKKGSLRPGPVEVRLGRPIAPEAIAVDDMEPVVAQIRELLDADATAPAPSRVWTALHTAMDGPVGMVGAATWGFAEAVSLPVTSEMYLALVGASHPRRVLPAAAWLTAGSVAGVLATRALTARGTPPPLPCTTVSMRAVAAAHMAVGPRGIWGQALNGVPVKLYAAAAAHARTPVVPLVTHTLGARGARALAFGAVIALAAKRGQPVLRRSHGLYLGALGVAYAGGLALVVRRWRKRS